MAESLWAQHSTLLVHPPAHAHPHTPTGHQNTSLRQRGVGLTCNQKDMYLQRQPRFQTSQLRKLRNEAHQQANTLEYNAFGETHYHMQGAFQPPLTLTKHQANKQTNKQTNTEAEKTSIDACTDIGWVTTKHVPSGRADQWPQQYMYTRKYWCDCVEFSAHLHRRLCGSVSRVGWN